MKEYYKNKIIKRPTSLEDSTQKISKSERNANIFKQMKMRKTITKQASIDDGNEILENKLNVNLFIILFLQYSFIKISNVSTAINFQLFSFHKIYKIFMN